MKKALSIILALTLVFSLLPTFVFAAETETETTMDWSRPIVFDFGTPTNPETITNGAYLNLGDTYKGENYELSLFKTRSAVLNESNKVKTVSGSYGKYIQITPSDSMIAAGNNTFTIALKVPENGIYDISGDVYNSNSGATTTAVVKNQTKETNINIGSIDNIPNNETGLSDNDGTTGPRTRVFSEGRGLPVAKTSNWETAENSAHIDNHIILTITKNKSTSSILYNLKLTPSNITAASVTIPSAEYKVGDNIIPSVSLSIDGLDSAKEFEDLDMAGIVIGIKETDADVSVSNNVITATKAGEITFTPTVTVNGKTHNAAPITLNVASNEDEALTDAFTVKETPASEYVAPAVVSVTVDGEVISSVKNEDGSHKITAENISKSGAKFLYWAKGLSDKKRIISFSNVIENYIPEEDGANFLIAVYDDYAPGKSEYYNANGQLIATETAPEYPSMAGYGTATAWNRYGDTNIYVAEYNNKTQPDNVTITVNGNDRTVPYGTEIVCNASEENFKCWTKTNINGKTEIISADNEYRFLAWEDCTVEAIYAEFAYTGKMAKIVVDSFAAGNETGVMAEFIGFGNDVVEKGIIFNGKRIAMTKPGKQFSVIADKNGEYEGYAIVGNAADGYTLITDGSAIVTDAE